jgi:hypothetical protein
MIDINDTRLWFSKNNRKKLGFYPVVKPVRIIIEHPAGVWRKLIRIVPYSDGGFAVMMPYHVEHSGFLYKARVHDTRTKLLRLPQPIMVSRYIATNKVKMSFHSDGATQFSSMNGRIISGRDSATGAFKGLGIMARPFTDPVTTGPTFGIMAWGLTQFETCKPGETDIRFTVAEMANPYHRHDVAPAVGFAAHIITRMRPIASTPTFPDYRAIWKMWIPVFGTFENREVRLIALHSDDAAIKIHAKMIPNMFSSLSGFQFGSPRDKDDCGIYAVYPRQRGMWAHQSLDYVPLTQNIP